MTPHEAAQCRTSHRGHRQAPRLLAQPGTHEEGKHKARVFAAALELDETDADWLRAALLDAANRCDCEVGRNTPHGQRYLVDFSLTKGARQARVRSVWNVRPGENAPRLVTCYVL